MTRNAAVQQADASPTLLQEGERDVRTQARDADLRAGPTALKILVLTPQFPFPPHQGTTIRNYNLIAYLAERHAVHLLSFGNPAQSRDTPLQSLCRSVQIVRPPQRAMRQRLTGLLLSRLPDMAQRLPSTQFRAALAATLEREDPDVVQVEGIELAQYLFQAAASRAPGRQQPLLVFDEHNAEYVLQQRAFETDARRPRRWIGAAYSFVQWQRLRSYERRACLAADRVVAVSETDATALRRLKPGLSPVVVPNGVDMVFYTAPSPALDAQQAPSPRDLAFTGKMDFRPNVDAVLWFVEEVLPLLRLSSPDSRFWVVGQNPHPRLAALADHPGVVVTGQVEDVRPYIAAAGVYVVPLRIGGGTRLKVLEAMAMGKAIVSTRLGCEGFDLVPGQELAIADTPAEFASVVLDLLGDPDRRERIGRAARRFAGSRYDWSVIVPRLEKIYAESRSEME
ncbi:MAG: glycosyltransferase [Anaerolineae bacterium]|nr:glycosyltransferase [Anaerolineae bacterium]